MVNIKQRIKEEKISEDLHGLLLAYKQYNTYFRILKSEDKKTAALQMADNPANWIENKSTRMEGYVEVRRIELNINTLFINYVSPQHILFEKGTTLGLKLPINNIIIENRLDEKEKNYFLLIVPLRFLPDIVKAVQDFTRMPPQVKYELVENYLVNSR